MAIRPPGTKPKTRMKLLDPKKLSPLGRDLLEISEEIAASNAPTTAGAEDVEAYIASSRRYGADKPQV